MSQVRSEDADRFSLQDLVLHCRPDAEYVWAKRCLVDAIIPIWFKEDLHPDPAKFHMIRFRDEGHARSCCRGEATAESFRADLSKFEKDYPENALPEREKIETFSIMLVSGPEFATFLRIPRSSMAFWSSIHQRLSAKDKVDQKKLIKTWCNGCLKRDDTTMLKCRNCKAAPYCSRQCIKRDWQNHKSCCQRLAANRVASKFRKNK